MRTAFQTKTSISNIGEVIGIWYQVSTVLQAITPNLIKPLTGARLRQL